MVWDGLMMDAESQGVFRRRSIHGRLRTVEDTGGQPRSGRLSQVGDDSLDGFFSWSAKPPLMMQTAWLWDQDHNLHRIRSRLPPQFEYARLRLLENRQRRCMQVADHHEAG